MSSALPNSNNQGQPITQPRAVVAPRVVDRSVTRRIPDLRDSEGVVLLQRQHHAVLFRKLTWPLALFVIWLVSGLFVLPLISSLQPDPLSPSPSRPFTWLPGVLWLAWMGVAVFLVLWAIYRVLDWSDDWIALTTRRIILMNKVPLIRETRREAPLGKVQNVTAEYPNSVGMALDYGNLRIDTPGIGVLAFDNLPHPKVMREAIFAQQALLRAQQPSGEDLRKQAVRGIILGKAPDRNGSSNTITNPKPKIQSPKLLSSLFPLYAQRSGQSVTWHKHWIFLLRDLALPVLLWVVATVCWFALLVGGQQGQFSGIAIVLGWAVVVLTPACFVWSLWHWENWRNDLYRLDEERVYDIESLPFGLREVSKETLITRVTDVAYVVPGPLAHLLNYGDVVIKTPGEATEFIFKHIPCPREVQQEIMERVDEYRLKSNAGADREIEAWLRAYHDVQRGK